MRFFPFRRWPPWATWIGPPSLLAATALTLIMIGRMQRSELRMRVILFTATPVGMAYDLIIGSLPAFAGGAIAMVIGAAMLYRLVRDDPGPSRRVVPAAHALFGHARSTGLVSLGQGGAGLGTMWGWETAQAMLEKAGFQRIERTVLPHDPMNVWFVARKD